MKFLIKNFVLLFCICVFSIFIKAQSEKTEPAPLPPKKFQCTSELFNDAEYYYRQRKFRQTEVQALRHIKKILDVCPNAELMPYLQEQLEILEEEKAEINFIVGDYYLKQAIKFQNRGLNGAKFRFLEIVEKYPNYSKMDEVLFLLGETYLLEKDFKKAREYFEKVSDEFPESTFARQSNTKASIAFNEMCLYKKPVYINGEVENQGIIIISDDTTLMQAIDKAGGIRPKVKVKYITIYRKKSGTLADRETIKFKLKELKKKKIEDPILKPCDVIDVEGSSKFSRPQDYEGIDIL